MNGVLFSVAEVSAMIQSGKRLILSGSNDALAQLPDGEWIGGTTTYFMSSEGGCVDNERIFVNEIPEYALNVKRMSYSLDNINNIYNDAFEHGYTVLILPFQTPVQTKFALEAPTFENFAQRPLAGWVAAIPMEQIANPKPSAVFDGSSQAILDMGVVFHIELPANKVAEVKALSLFKKGDGASIEFIDNGYEATEALIDGKRGSIFDYVVQHMPQQGLPLVADYFGTMINSSIMPEPNRKCIICGAPVFKGVKYYIAAPVGDYVQEFDAVYAADVNCDRVFSCNCMLNFMYGQLLGRKTGNVVGPITGGEICYQLVNQTLVNIDIYDI